MRDLWRGQFGGAMGMLGRIRCLARVSFGARRLVGRVQLWEMDYEYGQRRWNFEDQLHLGRIAHGCDLPRAV